MARFQGVERYTKKCCLVAGVIATVLYFVLREPIIRLFISDEGVVSYGVEMLVAYMLSGPVIGILFVNMNCMQSVGHAFPATVLSVLRQGILLIPLLYLLARSVRAERSDSGTVGDGLYRSCSLDFPVGGRYGDLCRQAQVQNNREKRYGICTQTLIEY